MILRCCRVHVKLGRERDYDRFLQEVTLPFLRGQTGCKDVQIGRGYRPPLEREVVIISLWESEEALQRAGGSKWSEAVIDRDREQPLILFAQATHYHVLGTIDLRSGAAPGPAPSAVPSTIAPPPAAPSPAAPPG